MIIVTLAVTVVASLAKVKKHPEVYATHDVTGHHYPAGAELEELRAHGKHPEHEAVEEDALRGDASTRDNVTPPPDR